MTYQLVTTDVLICFRRTLDYFTISNTLDRLVSLGHYAIWETSRDLWTAGFLLILAPPRTVILTSELPEFARHKAPEGVNKLDQFITRGQRRYSFRLHRFCRQVKHYRNSAAQLWT